jgi:predicted phosphodiesterase
VLSDLQIPMEDQPVLWDLVVPFIRELRPYGVVLNGDIVDNYEISDYAKDPKLRHSHDLSAERAGAERLMSALAPVTKERIWIGGNHEDRYRRYAWSRVPELVAADILPSFESAFRLKEYGFRWKPYGAHHLLGKLLVTHGFLVRGASGASARAHFEKLGTSVLHGHTHRLGTYHKTNQTGEHAAYENGCLCRLDGLGYAQFPDWQLGFSVVDVFPGGLFSVNLVRILDRKLFMFGGQIVRRKR